MLSLLATTEAKRKAKTAKQPAAKTAKVHKLDDPAYLSTLPPKARKLFTAVRTLKKNGVF